MTGSIRSWTRLGGVMASCTLTTMAAGASLHVDQDVPDYDFQWAMIGAPGNRAYEGTSSPWEQPLRGRGRVNYRYRMSVLEVTTAQWMEFMRTVVPLAPNVIEAHSDLRPTHWGARAPNYGVYQLRTDVENPGMLPVFGLTWRAAAKYVNWLENGKQASYESILSGVYDASTFTQNPDSSFNDQPAHGPGARFWIPTQDEWMKAVHFDPGAEDAEFPGTGRWWDYPNSRDTALVVGPPGAGQTLAGLDHWIGISPYDVPLGSFPDVLTPWGLLDASGGASEWNEEVVLPDNPFFRAIDGDEAGSTPWFGWIDHVSGVNWLSPEGHFAGLRIASIVPSPSVVLPIAGLCLVRGGRSR
ncbi:MAG: SUMF1/EgtB/PvdO family nonheme iron enzyme [Phycisphaerales bacterium]|nr:SUMF1/EgtB/PvdO family nonheme iron enzyme [Phycisphaerales bacterium]